jgi:histone deacetylase 1/2
LVDSALLLAFFAIGDSAVSVALAVAACLDFLLIFQVFLLCLVLSPIAMATAPAIVSSTASHSFSQVVSCKLDEKNFLTWQQVNAVLRGHQLEKFVVNPKIPLKFLSEAERELDSVNPEFLEWDRQDSLILSWLLSTLSESILARVVSCRHSYQVWDAIFTHFHYLTKVKATQLRLELRTLKKGTRSCSEYLQRISTIIDILSSIGAPVTVKEHTDAILASLPSDYDPLISTITAFISRNDSLSPSEIENMLLAQEARLEQVKQATLQEPLTINLVITPASTQSIPQLSSQQPSSATNLVYTRSQNSGSQQNAIANLAYSNQPSNHPQQYAQLSKSAIKEVMKPALVTSFFVDLLASVAFLLREVLFSSIILFSLVL